MNTNLVAFYDTLHPQSKMKYKTIAEAFCYWYLRKCDGHDMNSAVIEFFKYNYYTKNVASTTLRGWSSIIKNFYLMTGRGELDKEVPILSKFLNQWDKQHTVKQAATFTRDDLLKFRNLINTPLTLCIKVFMEVGLAFAARGGEVEKMDFNHVIPCVDDKGNKFYRILYTRKKNRTVSYGSPDSALVVDPDAVRIVDEYINCFRPDDRFGRFFRYTKRIKGFISFIRPSL